MNIVCKKIELDLINRKPGIVTVSLFNSKGIETQSIVFPGGLFPADLVVGDELIFEKRRRIPPNPTPPSSVA